ncbi:MAG: bifunctional 5,10-methylenetetrahydrofolate dehydrogenase/5,10-methenyltetrahydrofolate cyclohydrolase [Candidatus Sungbacteria bacterium]|nr:bifunctional 5,10-methylenetetrahydrofolate dehydrogenase/5,10-methenyltetrahydrofolate cyclohydrolase [Candidatus Sungbacteria bacterium]
MQLFDGKALAEELYKEIKKDLSERKLSLGVVAVGANEISKKFIEQKKKKGEELGVQVRVYEEAEDSNKKLRRRVAELVKKTEHDGFIIQLPMPKELNTQYILNAVPEAKDVDVLNQKSIGAFAVGRSQILPPLVGAVKTLLESEKVSLKGKKIAVVGAGRLVGRPIALWLLSQNLPFTVLTEDFLSLDVLRDADIIISGAGKPHLIHASMVKEGVAVIDCGTSIEGGVTKGDIDAESFHEKVGWLSPVPGGVGPLTVAYIFKNLVALSE